MKDRRAHGPIKVLVLVVRMKEIEHLAVFGGRGPTCCHKQAHVERRKTNGEHYDHGVCEVLCSGVLGAVAINAVVGDQIRYAVDRVAVEGCENGGADGGIEKVGAEKHPAGELRDQHLGALGTRRHQPEEQH